MKLELLVIADQNAAVNAFPGQVVTAEKKQMNYLKITLNLSQVSHVH